jgi:myosin-1
MVPIPENTVYLPFPERANILESRLNQLSEISEERDSSSEGRRLVAINANDRPNKFVSQPMEPPESQHLKENIDPHHEPIASPAAIKRTNSRRIKQVDSEAGARPSASRQPSREQPAQSRTRPISIRHATRVVEDGIETREPEIETRPSSSRQASREQLPESKARPTSIRVAQRKEAEHVEVEEERPLLLREPTRRERPVRAHTVSARPLYAPREQAPTLADTVSRPSPPLASAPPVRRARSVRTVSANNDATAKKSASIDIISIPDDTPSESEGDSIPNSSFTDPAVVLARAAKLRDNIASALAGRSSLPRRATNPPKLPFVTKWVDYARKHGVGYVLEDGSIGCLFNATSRHPVTHVIVNNGFSHLQQVGSDLEAVGEVPLEYYTHLKGDELVNGPVETDRKRQTSILWAKFGKYMCQNLGDLQKQTRARSNRDGTLFMRYYQRLGSVGIWGFSNGCFQVS